MSEQNLEKEQLQAQLNAMRQAFISDLNKRYQDLVNHIKSFPIHPQALHQAFLFTDSGMLWAKEAITYSPILPVNPPQPLDTVDNVPESEKVQLEDLGA